MSALAIAAGALLGASLFLFIFCFNLLVRLRNRTRSAWHGLEAELQRRYALIPLLSETVKGYAAHEAKALLSSVRDYPIGQSPLTPEQASRLYPAAESGIAALLLRTEWYPDLKADESFLKLAEELKHTESVIANARKYYNACVMHYDNARQKFPCILVAMPLSRMFPAFPYLRLFEEQRPPGG